MSLREFRATRDHEGKRLDSVLASLLEDTSRTTVARLIAEDRVRVDGKARAASFRLTEGARIECDVPAPRDSALVAEDLPLSIVHEDASLIVVDKQAGIAVHPGAGRTSGTLVNALLFHCGASLLGIGGELRPGIVHRLDKGTTGLLVVAKTQAAHAALSAQFARRSVSKTYLAVVHGVPEATGRADATIGRSTAARTRMAAGARGGRPALSTWTRREIFGRSAALLAVDLRTGRTHQARVHLAHAGHPIVGDATYGGAARTAPDPSVRALLRSFRRPALHAFRLSFDHPEGGKRMTLESPIPADMAALLEGLRREIGQPRSRPK